MNSKASLVLTTINDPILLEDYFRNFEKYGHLDEVDVIVIPDKKTPESALYTCDKLKKQGMNIRFIDLDEQEKYLNKFDKLKSIIPYNSDNRRNIGYLMAYENNSNFLISIDDDNYALDKEDFLGEHMIVTNNKIDQEVIDSSTGWFNICNLLDIEQNVEIFARGFPYHERRNSAELNYANRNVNISINAGLWLKEPDLDGITWLTIPVNAKRFKERSLVLGDNTWSPINTQNTALRREVIPSYYFIKMGYPIHGFKIDRYGDIFSGYFSQKCAKHLGHSVRIGTPIANHKRNSHNYLNDATNELACIWLLEDILPWLTEVKLEGNSYSEVFLSLSFAIEEYVETIDSKFWSPDTKGYFHQMAYNMRVWLETCEAIG